MVHADARTDKDQGHAWIIDGFLVGEMPDSNALIYIHNNMGWGGSDDGYYEMESTVNIQGGGHDFNHMFGINPNITKK